MNEKPQMNNGATAYISNLPFTLTNSDLYKLFGRYGKIVNIKILKNDKRQSRGVAFLQFLHLDDAKALVSNVNNVEMFGRLLKASLAKDNGRNAEFLKKRKYPDKHKCYECGEEGHLSYSCPTNILGDREPPPKKIKPPKKKQNIDDDEDDWNDRRNDSDNDGGNNSSQSAATSVKKPRYKKSAYLSDEEELSDGTED